MYDIFSEDQARFKGYLPKHNSTMCYDLENLGMELDLPDANLSIIENDNRHSVERCYNVMLSRWLKRDSSASWQKFLTAIDTCTSQGRQGD